MGMDSAEKVGIAITTVGGLIDAFEVFFPGRLAGMSTARRGTVFAVGTALALAGLGVVFFSSETAAPIPIAGPSIAAPGNGNCNVSGTRNKVDCGPTATATPAAAVDPTQNVSLVQDCTEIGLPIRIPAGETAYLVVANEKWLAQKAVTLFSVPNSTEKSLLFPDKATLKKLDSNGRNIMLSGRSAEKCVVSNHGSVSVINAAIQTVYGMNKSINKPYNVMVGPVDPTKPFTYYFVSDCPTLASFAFQETARIKIAGSDKVYDAHVGRPGHSIGELVVVLPGSPISWVGTGLDCMGSQESRGAPVSNSMGDISGNTGIITQGQTGNNSR
jgi:hypothetical protein